MNRVSVEGGGRALVKTKKMLRSACLAALRRLGKRNVEVAVYLVGERDMRLLNSRYRKKRAATNVLSFTFSPFPFEKKRNARRMAGELYLCPSVIARRGEDIRSLAMHGLLHLFGYTHDTKRDRITMEAKEKKLLSYNG